MILTVRVIPRARKNEIAGYENGVLKVRLHAVPEKGKANEELIDFLAEELDIPKSSITFFQGQTSRIKGLDEKLFLKRYL